MSESYEEIIAGEVWRRSAPGARHELICARLQGHVAACVANLNVVRLLPPRTVVQVTAGTLLRPDLALVAAAGGKLLLAVEVISSQDHRTDTVTKKAIYEEINVARLWVIDPRYDNVEIYHGSEYGLMLKGIFAGREPLRDNLLPALNLTVGELFAA